MRPSLNASLPESNFLSNLNAIMAPAAFRQEENTRPSFFSKKGYHTDVLVLCI